MEFTDLEVKQILDRIEMEIGQQRIKKYEFYEGSGVPSSLYSNWKTGKVKPTLLSLGKIADFLGVSMDYLITGKSDSEYDDLMELRQIMRERPEVAFLMNLAKNGRTSDILEASALLQRYKEESENK